jgi:hypothetical protein
MLSARLFSNAWWCLSAIGFVVAVTIIVKRVIFYPEDRRKVPGRDDFEPLVVGFMSLALLAFIFASAVMHVRENQYDVRYLTPVHICGTLGGAFGIALAVSRWSRVGVLDMPGLKSSVVGVAFFALWLLFPGSSSKAEYQDLRAASDWLGDQEEPPVLLGGYWGTYVFASLNVSRAIVPVPAEGEYQRTPWTSDFLRGAKEIVVSLYGYDGFGSPTDPETFILDRGNVLKRIEGSRWTRNEIVLWKYRNDTSKSVQVRAGGELAKWNACETGSKYLLAFEPIASGRLLLWAEHDAEVPAVDVAWIDEDERTHPLAGARQSGRLLSYAFESSRGTISKVRLGGAQQSNNCRIAAAAVVRER